MHSRPMTRSQCQHPNKLSAWYLGWPTDPSGPWRQGASRTLINRLCKQCSTVAAADHCVCDICGSVVSTRFNFGRGLCGHPRSAVASKNHGLEYQPHYESHTAAESSTTWDVSSAGCGLKLGAWCWSNWDDSGPLSLQASICQLSSTRPFWTVKSTVSQKLPVAQGPSHTSTRDRWRILEAADKGGLA